MRTLGLVAVAVLLTACSTGAGAPSAGPTSSPSATQATKPPRPSLDDLPRGAPPRIGYVDHQVYVAPGGRRTPLPPRLGVSGIVPYAGGFLVSDTRYFEGTVGLNVVRHGRVVDGYCSTGVPTLADGWVTWLVAYCPESADFVRVEVHRARPDGSHETARRIPPRSVGEVAVPAQSALVPDLPHGTFAAASAREDAHHVLAVLTRGRWTAIARIGPGGDLELATPVVRYDPNLPAYALGPGR